MPYDYEKGAKHKTTDRQLIILEQFTELWNDTDESHHNVLSELYNAWLRENKLPAMSADDLWIHLVQKLEATKQ
jgi:hypothetical protein